MKRQTFQIMQRLAGRNEAEVNARSNRYFANKVKQDTQNDIRMYIRANHIKRVSDGAKAIVVCEFYEPIGGRKRGRDVDNIESSVKYILDALVGQDILVDDNRKYLLAAPCYTYYGGINAKCIVTIIEDEDTERLMQLLKVGRDYLLGINDYSEDDGK